MTDEQENKVWDAVIIGGGPAGLAAAIYLSRDLFSTLVIEDKILGGMMAQTDRVDNYPAVEIGTSGFAISKAMGQQAKQSGAQIQYGRAKQVVVNQTTSPKGGRFTVQMEDQKNIRAQTVLLATGTSYRRLNVLGEAELIGKSVHFCATCDGPLYRDKTAVVIGGGNSAVEEALFLARFAQKVYLLVREKLTAIKTLQNELMSVVETGKIQLIMPSSVVKFEQEDDLLCVTYASGGKQTKLRVDGVFVAIGVQPQTELAQAIGIECDEYGFIKTQGNQTSIAGLFAAGDIVSGNDQQIAVATGDGVRAALRMREYLQGRDI